MLRDAAVGGAVALAAGGVRALAVARPPAARPAALGVAALLAADLLRTGAGLNPDGDPAFFALSPEMTRPAPGASAGRVFTCDPARQPRLRPRAGRRPDTSVDVRPARDTLDPAIQRDAASPPRTPWDLTISSPERVLDVRRERRARRRAVCGGVCGGRASPHVSRWIRSI